MGIKSIGKALGITLPESLKKSKKEGKTNKGRDVSKAESLNYVEADESDVSTEKPHKKNRYKKIAAAFNIKKKAKNVFRAKKQTGDNGEAVVESNDSVKDHEYSGIITDELPIEGLESKYVRKDSSSDDSGISDDDQLDALDKQENFSNSDEADKASETTSEDKSGSEVESAYAEGALPLYVDTTDGESDRVFINDENEPPVAALSREIEDENDQQNVIRQKPENDINSLVASTSQAVSESPSVSIIEDNQNASDIIDSLASDTERAVDGYDINPKNKKKGKKFKGIIKAMLGKKETTSKDSDVNSADNQEDKKNNSSMALDIARKKNSHPKQVAKAVVKLASAIKHPQDTIGILLGAKDTRNTADKFVPDVVRTEPSMEKEKTFDVKAKTFKNEWLANNIRKIKKEKNISPESVNKFLLEKRELMEDSMPMIQCMVEWSYLSGKNKRAENLQSIVSNLRAGVSDSLSRKEFQEKLLEIDELLVKLDKILSGEKTQKYLLEVMPKKATNRERMLHMFFRKLIADSSNKVGVDRFDAVSDYLSARKEGRSDENQLYFNIMKAFFYDCQDMLGLIDSTKDMVAICDFIDQYMRFQGVGDNLERILDDVDSIKSNGLTLNPNIENDVEKARKGLEWFSSVAVKGEQSGIKFKRDDLEKRIKELRGSVRDCEVHKEEVSEKNDLLRRASYISPEFVAEIKSCDDEVYQAMEKDDHNWNHQIVSLKGIKLKNGFLNKVLPKSLIIKLVKKHIVDLDKRVLEDHSSKVANFKKLRVFLKNICDQDIKVDGLVASDVSHQTYTLLVEMLIKNQIEGVLADKIFDSLFNSENLASSINRVDFNFLVSVDRYSLNRVTDALTAYEAHINEEIKDLTQKALNSKKLNFKIKKLRKSDAKVKAAMRVLKAMEDRKIMKSSLLSIMDSVSKGVDGCLVDQKDKKHIDNIKNLINNAEIVDFDGYASSVKDEKDLEDHYEGGMTKATIDKELLQYLKRDKILAAGDKDQFNDVELKLYEAKAYIKLWSSLSVDGPEYKELPRDMHRFIAGTMQRSTKIKEEATRSGEIMHSSIDTARILAQGMAIAGIGSRLNIAAKINRGSIVVMQKDFPSIETLTEMAMLRSMASDRNTFLNNWKAEYPDLSELINKKHGLTGDGQLYIDNLDRAEQDNGFVVGSLLNAYQIMLNDALTADPFKIKNFLSDSVIGQYFLVKFESDGRPILIESGKKYTNFLDAEKMIEAINHEIRTEGGLSAIHKNVMKIVSNHADHKDKFYRDKEEDKRTFIKLKEGAVYSAKEAVSACQILWDELPVGLVYFSGRRQILLKELKKKAQQAMDKGKSLKSQLISNSCQKIEGLPIDSPDFINEVHNILDQLYTDLKKRKKLVQKTKSYGDLVQHAKSIITHQGYQEFIDKFTG